MGQDDDRELRREKARLLVELTNPRSERDARTRRWLLFVAITAEAVAAAYALGQGRRWKRRTLKWSLVSLVTLGLWVRMSIKTRNDSAK